MIAAPAPGFTLVEASAGTGKTREVTNVVVTALATGTRFDEMLLVTFTTKATSELRDRVWRRLREAVRVLRALPDRSFAAGDRTGAADDDPSSDAFLTELCEGDAETTRTRLERLESALAGFDAATITTIHSFCQQVLQTVGFAADVEHERTVVEDCGPMVDEIVDDLLIQRLHANPDVVLARTRATSIARTAITNGTAPLLPEGADRKSPEGLPVSFGNAVRARVDERTRQRHVLSYDDLLGRVAKALVDDERGVRRRLQEQFRLVVVDEFQDTDDVQWRILRDAFRASETAVVLVGDPKQAIYAFRGADVHAYLAAADTAGKPDPLAVNWRSDGDLLAGLDLLFDGVDLGHPAIPYRSIKPAPDHDGSRLTGGRRMTPIRVRMVRRGPPLTAIKAGVQKDAAIAHVAADLAADVVRLLEDGTSIPGDGGAVRRVIPGDVAVLVKRNDDALVVQRALTAVGVPAVVNGAGSVYATVPAREWTVLLDALDQPSSRPRARAAALTSLLGWRAVDINRATPEQWDELHGRLHAWRATLVQRGVAPLFTHLRETSGLDGRHLTERLLAETGGERLLSDHRHLVELAHEAAAVHGTSPSALTDWLRERRREALDDVTLDDRSRRLDTDADAVQVWTVHRSKGQEFPIVYVPFLWMPGREIDDPPFVFHDPDMGCRVVNVGGGARVRDHRTLAAAEAAAEELRVAYVALTRARHQVIAWWVPGMDTHRSALARLLFGRGSDLDENPSDDVAATLARALAQQSGRAIGVEDSPAPVGGMTPLRRPDRELAIADRPAVFARTIDRLWRRTSYSALTAAAYDAHVAGSGEEPAEASEHDERGLDDEWMPDDRAPTDDGPITAADEARLRATPSRFGDIGGGALFGNLVHSVLEHVDFAAPDLEREVRSSLGEQYLGAFEGLDADTLVAGLAAAVETPLGPLVGDRALRSVARGDRLDELHFELPLVGGDDTRGTLTMAAIAAVVSEHLGDDPVIGDYGAALAGPLLTTEIRGHLSGSIDVVLRDGDRYLVVDHKSNWLGVDGEDLSAWHYRPDALADAMVASHYPLQALLYQVALHRYLRWRLPGYAPETELGGVLYLFLRGMTGPDVPRVDGRPCGVFAWAPPVTVITALSDLFDHGDSGGVTT